MRFKKIGITLILSILFVFTFNSQFASAETDSQDIFANRPSAAELEETENTLPWLSYSTHLEDDETYYSVPFKATSSYLYVYLYDPDKDYTVTLYEYDIEDNDLENKGSGKIFKNDGSWSNAVTFQSLSTSLNKTYYVKIEYHSFWPWDDAVKLQLSHVRVEH